MPPAIVLSAGDLICFDAAQGPEPSKSARARRRASARRRRPSRTASPPPASAAQARSSSRLLPEPPLAPGAGAGQAVRRPGARSTISRKRPQHTLPLSAGLVLLGRSPPRDIGVVPIGRISRSSSPVLLRAPSRSCAVAAQDGRPSRVRRRGLLVARADALGRVVPCRIVLAPRAPPALSVVLPINLTGGLFALELALGVSRPFTTKATSRWPSLSVGCLRGFCKSYALVGLDSGGLSRPSARPNPHVLAGFLRSRRNGLPTVSAFHALDAGRAEVDRGPRRHVLVHQPALAAGGVLVRNRACSAVVAADVPVVDRDHRTPSFVLGPRSPTHS